MRWALQIQQWVVDVINLIYWPEIIDLNLTFIIQTISMKFSTAEEKKEIYYFLAISVMICDDYIFLFIKIKTNVYKRITER